MAETYHFDLKPKDGGGWSYERIALSFLQDIRDTLHDISKRLRIAEEFFEENRRLRIILKLLQHRDEVERKFGDKEVLMFSEFATGLFWDIKPEDIMQIPFLELEKAGRGYRVRLLRDKRE